jgi:glycopeptide antibiotics resistance protein
VASGLGWEWYEIIVNRVPDLFIGTNEINPLSPVWLGKISDLVVNLIGTILAVSGYFWCNKISKKVNNENKNNGEN